MNLFRLQNNTPPVYTEESRDFQLFCRLYDCIFAGFKYDADQIPNLMNPFLCRDNMLPLLETKLGFFTNKLMDDTAIRYILSAFPLIIKNKGSLRGVQYAINTFLKIYDIRTSIMIFNVNNAETLFNIAVDDHTLVIALNQTLKDIKVLEELLSYVLPTGYSFQFYFYNTISDVIPIITNVNAKLIFVSDNINAMLRQEYVENVANNDIDKLIGAVDTMNLASTDSKPGVN